MRAGVLRSALVLVPGGAVAGALVTLGWRWWAERQTTEFGFSAYSPLPNAVNGEPGLVVSTDWWALLWPAVAAGALLGVVAVGALAVSGRRVALGAASSGGAVSGRVRQAGVLATSGAVFGLVLGLALYLVARLRSSGDEITTYHASYVPLNGLTMSKAYESSLSITLEPSPSNLLDLLKVCTVAGLVLGLLVVGVLLVTKRRVAVVSGSSPTG